MTASSWSAAASTGSSRRGTPARPWSTTSTTAAAWWALATQPYGINDDGTIVGIYDRDGKTIHWFVLRKGRFTAVDAPGAAPSTALFDINNRDQIAGFRDTSGGRGTTPSDAMLDVPTMP